MQKYILLLCSFSSIGALTIGLSSCKDDEPFVKPNLSVASSTLSIGEAGGSIQVEVTLDKGAPEDITIEYDLGGTAVSPADYSVSGKEGEIEISKGETSGTATIQIVSDALYEGNETIELSLDDVSSDDVLITNDDEVVITITDDDTQIKASFQSATLSAIESDNILNVNVVLDKAAAVDVTIQYTLSGTARDSVTAKAAEPDLPADYSIVGLTSGQLVIKAGQTTGVIRVNPYSDLILEDSSPATDPFDPEKIIITISGASNGIDFSTNNTTEISLHQEDGLIILLEWPAPAGAQQADMDLVLRVGENITTWEGILTLAAAESFTGPEYVFMPQIVNAPAYGVSYTYWKGTLDPLNFTATFIDFVDEDLEPEASAQSFDGQYTAVHLNEWSDPETTKVVQTFTKTGGVFGGFSAITPAASGSRKASTYSRENILKTLKKAPVRASRGL